MNCKTYTCSTAIRQLLQRFFMVIMVCIACFSQQSLQAADTPTMLKTWYSEDGSTSWRFANDELGQRFIYTKDSLRIIGTWELGEKNLSLNYKWEAVDTITIVEIEAPVASITDSLQTDTLAASNIIPKKPNYPIDKQLLVQKIDDKNLLLKSENQTYQLKYEDRTSSFDKIFGNNILRGIIGIFFLLLIAYLFSSNRRFIDWRLVGTGIVLQIIFGLLVLKVPFVGKAFQFIADFFVVVLNFSSKGAAFLFGNLVNDQSIGAIFAFKILPTVIFFSALSSMMYYLGFLQKITYGFAWIMSRTMRLSGAESLAAAANIFIGQTEAPLVVKPYLDKMTKSEIMCLMTGGMATIAGGVFAAFVGFLGGEDVEQQRLFAKHLLSASIMSAPAAIVAAKMLFPEVSPEKVERNLNVSKEKIGSNLLDAISNGTTEGLKLAVNVGAMLLVFLAMVEMANTCLLAIGDMLNINEMVGNDPNYIVGSPEDKVGLRLEYILGYVFAPLAWIIGVPSPDIVAVGQLLGQKTILNEFIAYISMGNMKASGSLVEAKSLLISTYALCGFANVSSIGIQIGGIGALAPSQRGTLAELGIKALIGGTIACLLTSVIAGMLIG
ncbi:MAG: NupC/NupG family nucleoside CNT transporter [Chitinophagales bacterium]